MKWIIGIIACFAVSFVVQLSAALLDVPEKYGMLASGVFSMAAFITVVQYYQSRKPKT
jgi:hypothetical protein